MKRPQSISLLAFAILTGVFGVSQLSAQTFPEVFIPPMPNTYPVQVRPQYPVVVTNSTIAGLDQFGRLVTTNSQIDNTVSDPARFMSQFNGSRRFVNRPVHNRFGQIVGYEQGWVWNNTMTGQEHGNTQVVTQNGATGGVHVQNHVRSKPKNSGMIHVHNRRFGRRP